MPPTFFFGAACACDSWIIEASVPPGPSYFSPTLDLGTWVPPTRAVRCETEFLGLVVALGGNCNPNLYLPSPEPRNFPRADVLSAKKYLNTLGCWSVFFLLSFSLFYSFYTFWTVARQLLHRFLFPLNLLNLYTFTNSRLLASRFNT